ncbi:hypothetical protein HMPREF1554_01611 [Porphyromonas gingivalis F0569]|nr:hypothetical protein HMPREF1554_01611 [Porphyromonas gingivalis F0569]ERJ80878.1 hypothetical protein HMPREF1988_02171 [Porphyromonas gingivalis F0185]
MKDIGIILSSTNDFSFPRFGKLFASSNASKCFSYASSLPWKA